MADQMIIKDRKDHSSDRSIITSIRVEKNPRHWWLTIWNRGGQAGQLCIEAKDGETIVNMLIPPNRQERRENS